MRLLVAGARGHMGAALVEFLPAGTIRLARAVWQVATESFVFASWCRLYGVIGSAAPGTQISQEVQDWPSGGPGSDPDMQWPNAS